MDKWLWAYASSMIGPPVLLFYTVLFVPRDDGWDNWCWVDADIGRNVEDDELAFYVAMITAAHV